MKPGLTLRGQGSGGVVVIADTPNLERGYKFFKHKLGAKNNQASRRVTPASHQ